jgi:anhydro-N-acetylmuramic acid kinase
MSTPSTSAQYIIGIMSGTSMDGVDAVLVEFSKNTSQFQLHSHVALPFSDALRKQFMELQTAHENEIEKEAIAANTLANLYAESVTQLLKNSTLSKHQIQAIGAHGQTIRHRPDLGFSKQSLNAARLADISGIHVIADFRSADIAAQGQGAPLVPAFHNAFFAKPNEISVVANIGGMSNISILDHHTTPFTVSGFDTGPGNVFLDMWVTQHKGQTHDFNGEWARTGTIQHDLLTHLLNEPFFEIPPPKSTGRDLFNADWLNTKLLSFSQYTPQDIQTTLTAFTAKSLVHAINQYAAHATTLYICGGGAYNTTLREYIQMYAPSHLKVNTSDHLGIAPNHVEAFAFAWLAKQFLEKKPGNLPSVTGANKEKILGALYPAS